MRVLWIDVCRGLGMLLVVAGHNIGLWQMFPDIGRFIYLFHMPLFFFISGLTININASFHAYMNRLLGLLVPYFILTISLIPLTCYFNNYENIKLKDIFLGLIYGTGHTIDLVPMWFLTCLAAAMIIVGLTIFISKKLSNFFNFEKILVCFCSLFLMLGGLIINHFKGVYFDSLSWGSIKTSGMIWSFDVAILGAGFILLGLIYNSMIRLKPSMFFFVGILSFVFVLIALHSGSKVDLNFRLYKPVTTATIVAISGIFVVVSLSHFISLSEFLSKPFVLIGQSTLIILWLHNGLQNRGASLLFSKLINDKISYWSCAFILGLLFPILIDKLLIKKSILNSIIYPRFNKK